MLLFWFSLWTFMSRKHLSAWQDHGIATLIIKAQTGLRIFSFQDLKSSMAVDLEQYM